MEWQPIDTAPKDGAQILTWGDGGFIVVRWNGRSWDDGDFHHDVAGLSYWMPIPPIATP